MTNYRVDAVVIGGGIAGLFTLAKLINAGYQAILLEKNALGCGQTIHSQGIIHGGTKYALLGKQTEAQRQIANMPSYWRDCLRGAGDIDLSACRVLADKQCMWAMPNLSSRVTGFFAGKMMKSRVELMPESSRFDALRHPDCRGQFYALDEPVVDVRSLIRLFSRQYGQFIVSDCQATVDDVGVNAHFNGKSARFIANKVIITAGQGNGEFATQQLRPLRMVYVRVPKAFGALFVHILEASDKPRLTISAYDSGDDWAWYLGGNIAEKGATLSAQETLMLAKRELASIFPWLDFSQLVFTSVVVNRAEGLADGRRPDAPTIAEKGKQVVAWPTKLALSPMLADALLAKMPAPSHYGDKLPTFPAPCVARFPWQMP